jgi:Chromo (CHRromatin Organisation MOdifier) domain
LKELRPLAKNKLAKSQARYKATFDRSVRENNKELQAGSWVYVPKEVPAKGTYPKLDAQVDGPHRVLETDGSTFQIQQGEQKVRISSDRITPAPTPLGEICPGTMITSNPSPITASDYVSVNVEESQEGNPEREAEYVVERIVGVRQWAEGKLRYRIRWYGYGRYDDTWQPLEHLPEDLVRRCHRRTRLPYPQ